MEIFFTILIMTLVVSLSGVVTRVLPFQVPLPLMQIAIGALLAWPTFGLHVEFDPELFLVLFIPPLLFADGWKTPTREFIEHGREILGLALALVVVTVVILLYSNAGLSIKSSIERIVRQYEDEKKKNPKEYHYAYEELKMATVKMKSGVSEINAINQYGERCGLHNYIKLANIIEQNIRRGTGELSFALENELNRALVERKNTALKRGSEISTKLLGPMTVMLIVALVILMVPALMSINM